MIIKTLYGTNQNYKVFITVPHGSSGETFFARFPNFWDFFENQTEKDLFYRYIRIEQDFGAKQLAHSFARELQSRSPDISSVVIENDYPRAIIDGGRQRTHAIRTFTPKRILEVYLEEFMEIHDGSLAQIRSEMATAKRLKCIGVDVHTMASYSPVFSSHNGKMREDYNCLEEYVEEYVHAAKKGGSLRHLDLITEDGHNTQLSNFDLAREFGESLKSDFALSWNTPYAALPHFMMNEYLTELAGLAVDVPKHLLCQNSLAHFDLEDVQLSTAKIQKIAKLMADAVENFIKKPS